LDAIDIAASAFMLANPAPFVAELAQPNNPPASRGLLMSLSPGDKVVPPDEGMALGRAARLIPRFPPENLPRYPEMAAETTPSVLSSALGKPTAAARIEWAHSEEGVPRLKRFPPDASTCGTNVVGDSGLDSMCHPACDVNLDNPCDGAMSCVQGTCQTLAPSPEDCAESLPDLDALAGKLPGFGAVQPIPLLRLARYAGHLRADNLADLWRPQSRLIGSLVQPTHPDWPFVAMAMPLADPLGSHGIPRDDLCQRFRFGNYVAYLLGRFIATQGTDYPPVTSRDTQQCLANPTNVDNCQYIFPAE
jgi:hypothetical protein